ncbi:hypothetical protein D3C75_677000 [compost metagenome]
MVGIHTELVFIQLFNFFAQPRREINVQRCSGGAADGFQPLIGGKERIHLHVKLIQNPGHFFDGTCPEELLGRDNPQQVHRQFFLWPGFGSQVLHDGIHDKLIAFVGVSFESAGFNVQQRFFLAGKLLYDSRYVFTDDLCCAAGHDKVHIPVEYLVCPVHGFPQPL